MLDAGHGLTTSGKRTPGGMKEYEFNTQVADYAKNLLSAYEKVIVFFTHSNTRDVPLTERTNNANAKNVNVYVSIHANAYGSGGWNEISGIETYVHPSRPSDALSLGKKIQANLVAASGLSDRGVKTADFHVLRETKMTAVLIECGFMTNRGDAALLKSDRYRKLVAEGIVKALATQYKLKKKKTGLYKVQVGAFSSKANAEQLANQLKQKGFSSYIKCEEA
ncbi:N-acetylmuramoyl-L-alanine amidase [Bacillus sp. 2205SS5-2]|uniref:N-acetylmuramoyl-L-alanine amidase n=1 Tax=Bacillus sp. 2205SS5-2 TaxID=3109031 RepID=UPI003005395D